MFTRLEKTAIALALVGMVCTVFGAIGTLLAH